MNFNIKKGWILSSVMHAASFEELDELFEYCIINRKEYQRQHSILMIIQNDADSQDSIDDDPNTSNSSSPSNPSNHKPHKTYQNPEIVNKDGTITRTTYSQNKQKQTIKTVQRIKKTLIQKKIPMRVITRRNLIKFGLCANNKQGPEPGITSTGDIVQLERPIRSTDDDAMKNDDAATLAAKSMISCRSCGERGHWTRQCPYGESLITNLDIVEQKPKSKVYVPPSQRHNTGGANNTTHTTQVVCHKTNIRISNLDENATTEDIRHLFERFGQLKRVNVVTDRKSGDSRGFAYVDFYHETDAILAMEKLNGHHYGHQILDLQWAKPRKFFD